MSYGVEMQLMIFLAIVEMVYSVYVMRKVNDDHMWHKAASKMMLMMLLIVSIRNMILSDDTTLMLIWVAYFSFLTHRSNKEILESYLDRETKERRLNGSD